MEEAIIFFDSKGWPYWRIEQGTKRLDHDDSGDLQTARVSLINHLALLTPGGYTLKVRPTLKADAGANQLDIIIARTAKTAANMQPTAQSQTVQELLKEAKEEAYTRAKFEFEIKQEFKDLWLVVNDLKKVVDDAILKLNDDDETNDTDAFETISKVAGILPSIKAGLQAIGKA